MKTRLLDSGWESLLCESRALADCDLRIMCPFISHKAVTRIVSHRPKTLRVITRFNLNEMCERVNDISALETLLKHGASIRGIRNLHAKLYIYGRKRAVITSANLTQAALTRNSEFGIELYDVDSVSGCIKYFDSLWNRAGSDLTQKQIDQWALRIEEARVAGQPQSAKPKLPDNGVDIGLVEAPFEVAAHFASASQYFVKFFATSAERESRSCSIREFINTTGCHRLCTYPKNKRPRQVRDEDVVFISALVCNPNDILIVGRGLAKAYKQGDDATEEHIERRPWKKNWPHYIRVHDVEFVSGTLNQGIPFSSLMNDLEAYAFASTLRNLRARKGNIDPRRSYLRQGAVMLSEEGVAWVQKRLEAAFRLYGKTTSEEFQDIP